MPHVSACRDVLERATCLDYSAQGLCYSDAQTDYMQLFCRSTCGFCGCEDQSNECLSYLQAGSCTDPSKKEMMLTDCKRTCKLCHCIDQASDCAERADSCDTNAEVRVRCRATCKTC